MGFSAATVGTWLGAGSATAAAVGTTAVVGAAATAASVYSTVQQKNAANANLQMQKDSAAKAEANKPQASQGPGVQGIAGALSGAGQAGGAPGVANTFLTGSQGVDPGMLTLGKNTLLGN